MKIVFIGYNYLPEYTSPQQWIDRIQPSVQIMEALATSHSVSYIGQTGFTGEYFENNVWYYFLDPGKRTRFPDEVHEIVKQIKPDLVIVPGFHFPLQIIQLRMALGKKPVIALEHHADKPFTGLKKALQKLADKKINAYHFTSIGNAKEWIDAKIIRENKCFEIPANTSYFSKLDKTDCRIKLNMNTGLQFLWVGRLDKNKDPITILKAWSEFILSYPSAKLHMIYQTKELLPEIKNMISRNGSFKCSVILHGCVPHSELETWYSAADFYISGSHREGGSIALMEAMSCGCIPIMTNIPAALKIIENGRYGLHFEAGNKDDLLKQLHQSVLIDKEKLSMKIGKYFTDHLSANAIAKRITDHYNINA